jgi:cellulose synthase operon protein YhjQ
VPVDGAVCLSVFGGNVEIEALAVSDQTPDDVATLYSWANLHGAKYRDFSATRAHIREQARQRVQEAMAAERSRAEQATQTDTALNRIETEGVVENIPAKREVVEPLEQPPVRETLIPQSPIRSSADAPPAPVAAARPELQIESNPGAPPASNLSSRSLAQPSALYVEQSVIEKSIRTPASAGLKPISVASPAVDAPPAEAISARWFALNSIFPENIPAPSPERGRVPAMAVFSLAGGVGKSSIVAALGRALSANGEQVLLVDTAAFGMLPFFYGAKDQRPDVLRSFVAPDTDAESRVEVLALDVNRFGPEGNIPEPFTKEILRHAGSANRVIIDLATASNMIVRRILRMTPLVLIPVLPDVGSVASVGAIEQFFHRNTSGIGQPILPHYVLNQFDESQRLHRDVREVLRNRLGDRLLPFALRSSPLVGEALAEGMTVMDYAPGSPVAEDNARLAEWVQNLAAPFAHVSCGARWSER